METSELFGRIARLSIASSALAAGMLSGDFRSAFRGQGMEFDEARHYQWGDDAKSIDWNASTRLGTPFVKIFREEREMSVMLLLDTSASMHSAIARPWGSVASGGGASSGDNANAQAERLSPYEQALLAAALVAFSAQRNGQPVGALLFDSETDKVFPPRKGRSGVLAFVSGALRYHRPQPARPQSGARSGVARADGSNLKAALSAAGRLLKRRGMVVALSDFHSVGWDQELGRLSHRHDVIAARAYDPAEISPPDLGLLSVSDPETGARLSAPTGSESFKEAWRRWHEARTELWQKMCKKSGASPLELSVTADAAAVLTRFFRARAK
ncbi:MAG: DUF58 domain-containing protein [Treponema sp.]|nr:DUF58 domain-containing protein [Treponema sp.]